jgi:hypothetical protein
MGIWECNIVKIIPEFHGPLSAGEAITCVNNSSSALPWPTRRGDQVVVALHPHDHLHPIGPAQANRASDTIRHGVNPVRCSWPTLWRPPNEKRAKNS